MAIQKHKISFNEDIYQAAVAACKKYNYDNISELVNAAVDEWLAQKSGQQVSNFISREIESIIKNCIGVTERRINQMLFKLAVSDAELKHIVAADFRASDKSLATVHEKSEREIRLTNGILDVKDAFDTSTEND